MERLTQAGIRRALEALAEALPAVWKLVEPYLVPGRQLKAQYAFDDLWEADRGHP
jgi:hypothetical protein